MAKPNCDPAALMLNIRDRSGIFMGYSESEFGFAHQSFQEYLAAEQTRNTGRVEMLAEKYDEKWWREVTLLCLALNNPSVIEDFLRLIIRTDHFRKDITLITDALNDSILKPLKPFWEILEEKGLSREARDNAIRIITMFGGDQAKRALEERKLIIAPRHEYVVVKEGAEALIDAIEGIIYHSKDSSKMVLIPAGTFLYGSREDDRTASSDEKPQRTIHLDDFYMDVFPVTNQQFCGFLNQTMPNNNRLTEWISLEGSYQKEKCRIQKKGNSYTSQEGYENHPVIYVSRPGAAAYAKWAGKRLPTEQEWEKVARGTDGRIYPWGDRFDEKMCNFGKNIGQTSQVDQFPQGISPFGCYDMAGNVWEWTESFYGNKKKYKVLRGGSWFFKSMFCRCAHRFRGGPYFRDADIGFRCART